MQPIHHDAKPLMRKYQLLIWLLSMLLVLLPFTELLKAATRLSAQMPCHQQTVSGYQAHDPDCLYELADAGCPCCEDQAPPAICTGPIPPMTFNLQLSTAPAVIGCSLPAPPDTSLYRPPILSAS